jgi:hypothetical protein
MHEELLEPDKRPTRPFYITWVNPVGLAEGVLQHSIRVRRSRVRVSATHIPLRIIIPAYRSPYGKARVAQTSGDGVLARSSRGSVGT